MITDTLRADYNLAELAAKLRLAGWQMRLAREHELLPEPDLAGGRWSADLAAECTGRIDPIRAAFGDEPPIGAVRAAPRVAARVRLDVERADIEILVTRGELSMVGRFQEHPVYLLSDLDGLNPATVAEVVAARKGQLADTVDAAGAARILGWPKRMFDRVAGERDLATDQLGRYALEDVRAIADDDDLIGRIHDEKRRVGIERARRDEAKFEDALRGWLLRCTAFVDRENEDPPEAGIARRSIRALTSARAALNRRET